MIDIYYAALMVCAGNAQCDVPNVFALQKLSRKLVHSTAGPLFVLTWPFFRYWLSPVNAPSTAQDRPTVYAAFFTLPVLSHSLEIRSEVRVA